RAHACLGVAGNNVIAVHQAAGEAVARARAGGGPTLLECKTYRTRPHAEGMGDFTYRSRAEVEAWKARDPLLAWRQALLAGGADERELEAVDAEVNRLIEDARQFAEGSPW